MAGRGGRTGLEQYLLYSASETGVEFGRGSYAAVVEVKYKGLRCAGKKIHDVFYEGQVDRLLSKFVEECTLLSRLRHPHIVQFLGTYIDSSTKAPVLVMEFLPATLAQCLDSYGIMPEEINYSVLKDIALGLHFLHDRELPIVHRDLSANNVLLSTDMRAKISDLGVAKILQVSPAQLSTMTKAPGTQSYMPPEALRPSPRYDAKVDIFSFGVMMVHILSGAWPIPSEAVEVDPDDPDKLTAISEFERRKEYTKLILSDHPLLPLIRQCLSNGSTQRPSSDEVLERVITQADRCPPSFSNRVELLREITDLKNENKMTKEKNRQLSITNEGLMSEKEELTLEVETYQSKLSSSFSHSTELELTHNALSDSRSEVEHLKGLLELKEMEVKEAEEERREEVSSLQQQLQKDKSDLIEEHRLNMESVQRRYDSEKSVLEEELLMLRTSSKERRESQSVAMEQSHKSTLSRLERKHQLQIESKTRELATKDAMIASKSKTIEALGEQLKQTISSTNQSVGSKQAHVFSPGSSLSFKECQTLPAPMFYITSTIIGSFLYAGGGFGGSRTADENVERSVYVYSIMEDKWTSPLPPAPVVKFAIAQLSGKIVLVGGRPKPSRVIANVYEYDEEKKEWTVPPSVPPMPTPRSSLTAISWKSPAAILACGGFDKSFNPQTCVEIFHQKSGQWTVSCPLPFPRAIATYTIIGNTVYVVGGYQNNSAHGYTRSVAYTSLSNLLKYQQRTRHSSSSSTSSLEDPPEWKTLPEVPNFFTSVSAIGGCLVVVGGQKESLGATSCISSVYVYCPSSPSAISWHNVGQLPQACTMCATITLPTGELLVMGGCTNNGLVNSVFRGSVVFE